MKPTPRQERAIKFLLRRYPDTVRPLLAQYGGSIERLTVEQASKILSVCEEKHPKDGGGERKEERQQQQEQKNEQQLDNDDKQEQMEQKNQKRTGFRPGSKQDVIAQALRANGLDVEQTQQYLARSNDVGNIPALTFKENVNGDRTPLPMGNVSDDTQQPTQYGRLRKTIFAVRRSLLAGGEQGGGQQQEHKQEQREEREEKQENKQNREAADFLAWVRQMRQFCLERAADGHPLDEIGLRPVENGAKMLRAEIPLGAIKHALTMHFPPEARRALGVREYDAKTFRTKEQREGMHAALPYVITLAKAKVPVALVGPKGTGKTHLASNVAEVLALPFGMVSMTSGTSPSAFNGRPKIGGDGGVVQSQFEKIYAGGGVFLFDEMDAADENLLLLVNAALANGKFANSATGEIVEQHPDFIPMCGMNTLGLGAGRDYNSRNKLDAATLDRWNAGRVKIDLDPRIEESIFWTIINGE